MEVDRLGFGNIHKQSEIFMKEGPFYIEIGRDTFSLNQDVRGKNNLVLEADPAVLEYLLDGFWYRSQIGD